MPQIAEIPTLAVVPIVRTEIDKLKRERGELVAEIEGRAPPPPKAM